MGKGDTDFIALVHDIHTQLMGTCECGNELSGSIKCGEFLECMRSCNAFRKNCAPWSQLVIASSRL
jgi:hypothetical protein